MAWTALGYDENTGMVRWNAGPGQDQYLQPGQDPNAGVAANPYGWDPNMAMPAGGWTVGQLLSPNYFSQGTTLDNPAALSQALADVAPGYAQPATIDMNAQVPVSQQRAPASDFELIPSLIFGGLTGALGAGFGQGGLWGDLTSALGGDGITSTMAGGGNPTQVGSSFMDGLTTSPDALNAAIDAADVAGGADMLNLGGQNYQQFLQSLGSGLPGLSGLPPAPPGGSGGANSLGGAAADAAANGLASGGGAAAAGGNALSRILNGTATTADWLSLAGTGGSTLLGMLGSSQQTQAYKDLAKQYMDFGAPSRARFEASMQPGFDVNSIPGYKGAVDTASESLLRRLSATGGNPYGNPGGMIEANKAIISGTALPAYNEYARLNANTGFGSSMNAAVPFQTAAIGSEGNSLNALGYGLGQLTQPPKQDLASLLKQYQGFGGMSLT